MRKEVYLQNAVYVIRLGEHFQMSQVVTAISVRTAPTRTCKVAWTMALCRVLRAYSSPSAFFLFRRARNGWSEIRDRPPRLYAIANGKHNKAITWKDCSKSHATETINSGNGDATCIESAILPPALKIRRGYFRLLAEVGNYFSAVVLHGFHCWMRALILKCLYLTMILILTLRDLYITSLFEKHFIDDIVARLLE